jgi:hypothetical protein
MAFAPDRRHEVAPDWNGSYLKPGDIAMRPALQSDSADKLRQSRSLL